MISDKAEALQKHLRAIAAILYEDTPPESLTSLEEIEKTVRQKVLKCVSPEIGVFLSKKLQAQKPEEKDT